MMALYWSKSGELIDSRRRIPSVMSKTEEAVRNGIR
jgi:hypothetical protein